MTKNVRLVNAATAPEYFAKMASVLIVDDSPDVRHVVRRFLERDAAFTVCGEAGNGPEAIKKAEALKPELVLLDLLMPEMNGIEAAAVLKRMLPKTQIAIFSNYTDDLDRRLASVVGIDGVIAKGSLTDMATSLKALIARKAL